MKSRCSVYVVKSGNFVKIGYAKDLNKRITQLQTGNPLQLALKWSIEVKDEHTARLIESRCHYTLRKYRVQGEWFNVGHKQATAMVNQIAASYVETEEEEMVRINNFIAECKEAGAIRFATDTTAYEGGKYYNKCIYVFDNNKQLIAAYSKGNGVIFGKPKNIDFKDRTFVDLAV